jgi:LPS sulfotransferase NodH
MEEKWSTTDRLSMFSSARVEEISKQIESAEKASWPELEGCLAVLITARVGSTYLSRELELLYDIGRMGETLNPILVKSNASAQNVAKRQNGWFAFKGSQKGVIAAELFGFFDAYRSKTAFVLLARRDIVAQAVSMRKAAQTGQWHSHVEKQKDPVYEAEELASSIESTIDRVNRLRLYLQQNGRPWLMLLYEDFSNGDFTRPMAACDAFGVPRRKAGAEISARPIERASDATNEAWIQRFNAEMSPRTRDMIAEYQAAL